MLCFTSGDHYISVQKTYMQFASNFTNITLKCVTNMPVEYQHIESKLSVFFELRNFFNFSIIAAMELKMHQSSNARPLQDSVGGVWKWKLGKEWQTQWLRIKLEVSMGTWVLIGAHIIQAVKLGMGTGQNMTLMSNSPPVAVTNNSIISCSDQRGECDTIISNSSSSPW